MMPHLQVPPGDNIHFTMWMEQLVFQAGDGGTSGGGPQLSTTGSYISPPVSWADQPSTGHTWIYLVVSVVIALAITGACVVAEKRRRKNDYARLEGIETMRALAETSSDEEEIYARSADEYDDGDGYI